MHYRKSNLIGVAIASLIVLPVSAGDQNEYAELVATDGALNDHFGAAVAHSGTTTVVGAPLVDDNGTDSGTIYAFDSVTGTEKFRFSPNDAAAFDNFGSAVASSGSLAVIGAFGADNLMGAAYLYDTDIRFLRHTLLASDRAPLDLFGSSVGISGTTAIVSSVGDDDNGNASGSAYLFSSTNGQELFKLLPTDGAPDDLFGSAVAISGALAVVGANADDDNGAQSGSAYVFDTATGQQLFKLLPDDGAAGDRFGTSVAISGTTAIIGAPNDDDNGADSGSVYLFDTATGQQLDKVLANDGAANDMFGGSVAISGTTAIVGAPGDDDNGADSGSAYVFYTPTSVLVAKLVPSDGTSGDEFGASVAAADDTIAVGAPLTDDLDTDAGSAYLFDGPLAPSTFTELPCIILADLGSAPRQFSVAYSGTAPLQYQWRFDGVPLSDNADYAGTATDTITIVPTLETEGLYDVVVTNLVGQAVSEQTVLGVRDRTPADINGDGIVDTADLGILIGNFGMMGP